MLDLGSASLHSAFTESTSPGFTTARPLSIVFTSPALSQGEMPRFFTRTLSATRSWRGRDRGITSMPHWSVCMLISHFICGDLNTKPFHVLVITMDKPVSSVCSTVVSTATELFSLSRLNRRNQSWQIGLDPRTGKSSRGVHPLPEELVVHRYRTIRHPCLRISYLLVPHAPQVLDFVNVNSVVRTVPLFSTTIQAADMTMYTLAVLSCTRLRRRRENQPFCAG